MKCDNPNCENIAEYYIEYGIGDGDYMCNPCMDSVMISDGSLIESIRLLRDNVSLEDTPDTLYEYITT